MAEGSAGVFNDDVNYLRQLVSDREAEMHRVLGGAQAGPHGEDTERFVISTGSNPRLPA